MKKRTLLTRTLYFAVFCILGFPSLEAQPGLNVEMGNSVTEDGMLTVGNESSNHVAIDADDIQAKFGTGYSYLDLNYYGGDIFIGRGHNEGLFGAFNTLFVDGASEKVGIGTTTPGERLTVQDGSIAINNSIPTLNLYYADGTTHAGSFQNFLNTLFIRNPVTGSTLGDIVMLTENGTLRLEENGEVGIQTDPFSDLHLKQSASVAGKGIRLEHNTLNRYWNTYVGDGNEFGSNYYFNYKGIDKASIDWNSGAYAQLSDSRLKTGISPLGNVLEGVLKLRPSRYYYINGDSSSNKTLGFIAQEVEQIFPEIVIETNGYKALTYDHFAVLGIKAIQEQQLVIEDQQERIGELEGEVKALRESLEDILQKLE